MISEVAGRVEFNGIVKDVTYTLEENVETDSSTCVIIDTRDRTMNPVVRVVDAEGTILKTYDLPVGARLQVEDGQLVESGSIIAKMDRIVAGGGGGRITSRDGAFRSSKHFKSCRGIGNRWSGIDTSKGEAWDAGGCGD